MPFLSKSQARLCFRRQQAGRAGSFDCDEFLRQTPDLRGLPERVGERARPSAPAKGCGNTTPICTDPKSGRRFLVRDGSRVDLFAQEATTSKQGSRWPLPALILLWLVLTAVLVGLVLALLKRFH